MRVSPERGCSSGSVDTQGHVSLSTCAEIKSLISLCLKAGKPPRRQLRPLTSTSADQLHHTKSRSLATA